MSIAPSARTVADYMTQLISAERTLPYDRVAQDIARRFGDATLVSSHTGRLTIRADILHAFYEHTKSFVVWSRRERAWRLRTSDDAPRRQVA